MDLGRAFAGTQGLVHQYMFQLALEHPPIFEVRNEYRGINHQDASGGAGRLPPRHGQADEGAGRGGGSAPGMRPDGGLIRGQFGNGYKVPRFKWAKYEYRPYCPAGCLGGVTGVDSGLVARGGDAVECGRGEGEEGGHELPDPLEGAVSECWGMWFASLKQEGAAVRGRRHGGTGAGARTATPRPRLRRHGVAKCWMATRARHTTKLRS